MPLLLTALLAVACGPRGSAEEVDVATQVAGEFLRALDAGDAGGTWRELASNLRESLPEAAWSGQIARMRAPLGRPVRRELISAAHTEQLAEAPPGRYFVVEFEAQFSEAACGERVVVSFERGAWRVAGYFVRNTRPRGDRAAAVPRS